MRMWREDTSQMNASLKHIKRPEENYDPTSLYCFTFLLSQDKRIYSLLTWTQKIKESSIPSRDFHI